MVEPGAGGFVEWSNDEVVDPTPAGLKIGQLLGGYRLDSLIGSGGMGYVFRGLDPRTGRSVAIKVARQSAQHRARLKREGELLASLDHPAILNVHSADTSGGWAYLVCELIEGCETLEDRLESLSRDELLGHLLTAADALGYAHQHGVLHRDLKAENLLLDRAGRLRVADFGLAWHQDAERLTVSGITIGTPHCMAPEQLHSSSEAWSPATDVWALGVLLYRMLAGTHPFPGPSLMEVRVQIAEGRFPSIESSASSPVPPRLSALCRACLQVDPGSRPPNATAFADTLRAALAGGTEASSGSATGARTVVGVLGAVGLLVLIVSVGWLTIAGPPRSSSVEGDLVLAKEIKDSDPERARALAQRVLETAPEDPQAWRLLGDLDLVQRPEQSVRAYRRSLAGRPDATTCVQLALALHRSGDSAGGLAAIERALELEPRLAVAYARRAWIHYDQRHYERALSAANAALEIAPEFAIALNAQALALGGLGRPAESEASLRKALALDRDGTILRNLGWLRAGRGDLAGAVRTMNEAIELEPENPDFQATLGLILFNGRDNQAAVRAFDRALALDPTQLDAYYSRGLAQARLGNREAALADLETFLEQAKASNPLREDALQEVARLTGGAKSDSTQTQPGVSWTDVIEESTRALELDPSNAKAWSDRGAARTALERYAEAIEDFDRALDLEPNAETYANRGACNVKLGRWAEAIVDYDRALELEPTEAEVYATRGECKVKLSRWAEAIEDYDRALELGLSAEVAEDVRASRAQAASRLRR